MSNMKNIYILAKYDNFFAILTQTEIKLGDFMADTKGVYQAPEIDGYIGFLKVIACTEQKDNLPLLNKEQIFIPPTENKERSWIAILEIDDADTPKVINGFVNLIGIEIPKRDELC